MTLLIASSLALLCFFQRCLFRIICPRIHGFDVYGHRFILECTRDLKGRFYRPINTLRYGRPVTELAYPKFYHAMACLFPKRSFHLLDRFMGPFLDGLFTLFIYWAVLQFGYDTKTASWMCLIFIFTPAFSAMIMLGPRMASFTPRGFSEIVSNMYWVAYLGYLHDTHMLWLVLAVLCGAIIIWSSKFSLQALVLISVAFCIFNLSLLPVLLVLASFILALLVANQMVRLSVQQQFDHLRWYCIQNLKGLMTISERNAIAPLWQAIRKKDLRGLVNLLLIHNSPFIVITRFPIGVIALGLVARELYRGPLAYPLDPMIALILAAFAIFLLSSLKWFLFIGEAERYLNHILVALLLFCGERLLPVAGWLVAWGVAYMLFDLSMACYLQRKDKKLACSDRLMELLQKEKGPCNVLEIPYGISGGPRMLTESEHNWVYPILWSDEDREDFNAYVARYPMVDTEKLDALIPAYAVHILMVDSSKVDPEARKRYESACELQVLDQVDQVVVYRTAEPLNPPQPAS